MKRANKTTNSSIGRTRQRIGLSKRVSAGDQSKEKPSSPAPGEGESSKITEGDDFVKALVRDARQPPKLRILTGWFGNSTEPNHTRLYLDPELRGYMEVPDDAILHIRVIGKEHSPLGGSIVWLRGDVQLKGNYATELLRSRILHDFFFGYANLPSSTQGTIGRLFDPWQKQFLAVTNTPPCPTGPPQPGYAGNATLPGPCNWSNAFFGAPGVTNTPGCPKGPPQPDYTGNQTLPGLCSWSNAFFGVPAVTNTFPCPTGPPQPGYAGTWPIQFYTGLPLICS